MNFSRMERVQNVIKQELAQIIDHELNNPLLPEFITVYSVKVSTDLAQAQVMITLLEDSDPKLIKQTVDELNKAAGYIRKLLAKRVTLKRHPVLHFAYNASTRYALDMAPLFHQIEKEHAEARRTPSRPTRRDTARVMPPDSVLLEHGPGGGWARFSAPLECVTAWKAGEVLPALERIAAHTRAGRWAAGYLTYEAAAGFERAMTTQPAPDDAPLLWFGIYAAPERLGPEPPWTQGTRSADCTPAYAFEPWQASLGEADYAQRIAAIREHIAAGDTYQVNFSYTLTSRFSGDAEAMFAALWQGQRGGHGALIHTPWRTIASFSPELFFTQQGETIVTRPMKGTAPRGRWPEEDAQAAARLAASEKDRAENVMIVDLLRNDLGRIARPGSVAVDQLFAVERYPTVWQMTSTVRARSDADPVETLRALFPCGSITGAPKLKTMEIIAATEGGPRGVYTGAIGWIGPGGESGDKSTSAPQHAAAFSVAIRTIEIEPDGRARYGVGGGVTWGSTPHGEWAETRTKAQLLLQPAGEPFELLETLRWSAEEGFALLERHLERMGASAHYFGFCFERAEAIRALETAAAECARAGADTKPAAWRLRLLCDVRGAMRVAGMERLAADRAATPAVPSAAPRVWKIGLAAWPIDSRDIMLFHKTTRRACYDAALAELRERSPGCDEAILHNERGELTEGTFTNLVLELDGRRWTPPLASGLLPGTLRAELLERGEIAERTLPTADLHRATRIWLINSVRGWIAAELAEAGVPSAPSPLS